MASVFLIFYVYLGYPVLLFILQRLFKNPPVMNSATYEPTVSIIIAAYNEEKHIATRLRNLLSLDYSREKLEIIVASDGSSDRTAAIARRYPGVTVVDFPKNRGRAEVHNDSARIARGEILVFTDAETEFSADFLTRIVQPFSNPKIGCTVGNLIYNNTDGPISASEGFYFRMEKRLRYWESRLGLLATGTGACMAVRKRLWRNLGPKEDCDFTTPLDVILQGFNIEFAPEAIAYDVPASSLRAEFRTRIRQTSRNLIGTLQRWGWEGWLRYPIVSLGLLSHKILRWFTPFFMIKIFILNFLLLNEGTVYRILLMGQMFFYMMVIIGLIANVFQKRIAIASLISSFCVANLGMGIGVILGLAGKAQASYKKST